MGPMSLWNMFGGGASMVDPNRALAGRDEPSYSIPGENAVLGGPLLGPWPAGTEVLYLGMGCFWGAERRLWQLPGVIGTAVGYMGGFTPHPT